MDFLKIRGYIKIIWANRWHRYISSENRHFKAFFGYWRNFGSNLRFTFYHSIYNKNRNEKNRQIKFNVLTLICYYYINKASEFVFF